MDLGNTRACIAHNTHSHAYNKHQLSHHQQHINNVNRGGQSSAAVPLSVMQSHSQMSYAHTEGYPATTPAGHCLLLHIRENERASSLTAGWCRSSAHHSSAACGESPTAQRCALTNKAGEVKVSELQMGDET